MTSRHPVGPEPVADVDALVADRYLDALLSAAERGAADVPADPALDPALRDAVATLRRALIRVHPSFRFEERVSRRLADLAAAQAAPAAVGAEGALVPFAASTPELTAVDPELTAILDGRLDPADPALARQPGVPRPVIVGGAMASAALSLVGVAYVAWRAAHPAAGPMARAARAARVARRHRVVEGALAGAVAVGGLGLTLGGPA